jgi:hypothetical protein
MLTVVRVRRSVRRGVAIEIFASRKMAAALAVLVISAGRLTAQTNIVTQHYDIARSGANTTETILTPARVDGLTFGKLFRYSVDAPVYAEPLYVAGITMGAGTPQAGTVHNVVFVATENDSIYAFDADSISGANADPLWQVTLLDAAHGAAAGATPVPSGDVSTADIHPLIGITGTPVIDLATRTLYVVGKTLEGSAFVQRLHALDITTGREKFNGPVALSGEVSGSGNGSSGGVLHWDPKWENQRPGLLELNGILYIGFAAHGDNGPWHGWLLAYHAATLTQTGVWCASPNGLGAGIWMSGAGLAADVPSGHPYGRMFVATGNGDYTASAPYSNTFDYGDSIVRLDLTGGVPTVSGEFTPHDQATLNSEDRDVASGGVLILPDQTTGEHLHELVQVGKDGVVHLVDRETPGEYSTTADNIVEEIADETSGLWSMPAYWNGNVYFGGQSSSLKAFSLTSGLLSTTPTSSSTVTFGYPGATPVVSSDGTTNGIVWAVRTDEFDSAGPAVLYALDAGNLATQLYVSDQYPFDAAGPAVKFVVPTVANGKVYVGTAGEVDVYGPGRRTATPVITPSAQTFTGSLRVNISDATGGAIIYYTLDGSRPTTESAVYKGELTVSSSETVTAIAALDTSGYLASGAASRSYTLKSQTPAPTFSPAGGSYAKPLSVTLNDASGSAAIYYTTNGTTPTTSSALYSGPISVLASETVQAIALASGQFTSSVSSAAYTITPRAATPVISPTTGTYTAPQMVTITDAKSGATIYYTTNGSAPTASSSVYKAAFPINATTTIQAIAMAPGYSVSAVAASTVTTAGISYSGGFTSAGMALNGSAAISGTGLRLTNGGGEEMGSAWSSVPLNVATFTTHFTFRLTSPNADGFTFAMQNTGTTALGARAGGLGYAGIAKSMAVKFDLYNNSGEGNNSTGLYLNGAQPILPATTLGGGVNLHSGDIFEVGMTYDGATLIMTITDTVSKATFTKIWAVNVENAVGGKIAYVGFTGGTGGATATQDILSWTMSSTGPQVAAAAPTLNPASGTYAGPQTVVLSDAATTGASIFYTLDGSTPTASSAPYSGPIVVTAPETVKAIAVAPGYATSAVGTATYGSFGRGLNKAGLALNGSAAISGTGLRLTNGSEEEMGSAWSSVPVNVRTFTTYFSFELTSPNADGFTFAMQNTGTTALGARAGGLGYAGIAKSVAVKFDLYNNSGEGDNSTGLYLNGAQPILPATTLGGGVNLHSGDIMNVLLTYDGTTLTMKITDTTNTALSFTIAWPVNIPSAVGSNTAYVGFTGSTGGATSTQDILSWSYNNTP